ncbi:bifunctional metallophosphatase/5'-nucleotidase [Aquibacillus kalidii]|uniref:bifunctional metallophosphatase/5'-nucleotidase n=1 Tax=Aquibacillus kalidii TaxID=2762597 RepID=UPI00164419EF|nr:bifunctional UDP-sugar hydrolase/5'-nucleotidase [Aquibacillus kalidii]
MEEKIFFYYTNDLHSHFENWSKIVSYFNQKKEQRKAAKQASWFLDIGDHVDRSHSISEAFMGKANVELLNHANYDIATIGNNEGITLDYDDLYHLYDHASFQLVCGNLQSVNKDNPSWLKDSYYSITDSGIKIGFIGLTAPFNAFYNLLGWNVTSPYEYLDRHIDRIANNCDIVILLSHLGINEDEEIARRYPDIDVIIGGHTHHLFRTGEYVNKTLLTAAGKHGTNVGEVILTWDHYRNKLVQKEGYVTNIEHVDRDSMTGVKLDEYQKQADQILGETVVTLTEPLEVNWFQSTKLMTMLVDTLMEWTNSDCAMLNAGLLLETLDAGDVSYRDIHRICPHPINPCTVDLNGNELAEVIRGSLTKSLMELELKGFGFRGTVIGKMVFAGLDVELEHQHGEYRVGSIRMGGKLLDRNKTYRVATADMFTFGQLLPEISRAKKKHFFMPEFLRDLLVHALKTKF